MKEMRKKGHRVFALIILFILAIEIFALIFVINPDKKEDGKNSEEPGAGEFCASDIECVPASCCHSTRCVSIKKKPACNGVFCTAVCEPGTLDCGQGSCKCVNNKCETVFK